MKYSVDDNGYYGNYGGAFIPEMLYPNIEELRIKYKDIINSAEFVNEFRSYLRDYAGRPTPLFFAERLSDVYKTASFFGIDC